MPSSQQMAVNAENALVADLNTEQRKAVLLPRVSSLVLAGAGSGKTTVIINRIAHLVEQGIPPSAILAVTFTNKASEEMKKRLRAQIGPQAIKEIEVGTFHSICHHILRENYLAAGLPRNFAILDTDNQESLIRTLVKGQAAAMAESGDNDESEEKLVAREVVKFINSHKERGIGPSGVRVDPGSKEAKMVPLFEQYLSVCDAQGLVDFSDLLYRTVALLQQNEVVREFYRDKIDAILVDEFQDTNDIQYRWLRLIKRPDAFVMAVGDDDQSIYAFRGAKPGNMSVFVQEMTRSPDHPQGNIIRLEQNYRSLPFILNSANALIGANPDRLGKNLWTSTPDRGEKIVITEYETGASESASIAKQVHRLIHEKKIPPKEIAVMFRTNVQSRGLEQDFNRLGIPVTVYGGFRFYERQEIKHLLAYLDLISSFDRDVSLSRIINIPPRGIGERTVEALRQDARENSVSMLEMIGIRLDQDATGSSAAAVKKRKALANFAEMIVGLAEIAPDVSLSTLVSHVLARSGLSAHYASLPEEEAKERTENIEEFLSATRQFELDHPELETAADQLPEYLSFVHLMTSTSKASMDQLNTVSLMTIHAAKGLEFDHVYLCGLEEGVFPHARSIADEGNREGASDNGWFEGSPEYDKDGDLIEPRTNDVRGPGTAGESPELQEERRIMYVAITRPRKMLNISYAKARLNNGEVRKQRPSRFLSDLPKQYISFKREVALIRQTNEHSTGHATLSDEDQSDHSTPIAHAAPRRQFSQRRNLFP